MNAKTFIRMFIYVLRVALWSPVIVLGLVITPFVWLRIFTKAGYTVGECGKAWWKALMNGIKYDMYHIKTGEW